METKQLLLIKIGTDQQCRLVRGERRLSQTVINEIARQIAVLVKDGIRVVLVVSGAIQAGREHTRGQVRPDKSSAALGQDLLMAMWRKAFRRQNISVGQFLVTAANWRERDERESLRSTILELCRNGDVPIMNENDPVSQEEIESMRQGLSENDDLAAKVAKCIGADAALFLTNVGGLFEADPHLNGKARRYLEVPADASPEELGITPTLGPNGRGGMAAKFLAAATLSRADVQVEIASYKQDAIVRFANGERVGTKVGRDKLLM